MHRSTVPIVAGVVSSDIEESLTRARDAVDAGEGLSGTGFWPVVSEVKSHPELVDEYANQIAEIDARALGQWAILVVPLTLGTVLMSVATVIAVGLVGWAYSLTGFAAVVAFYVGFGALLVTTHGLGHLLVGRLMGIKFGYWFLGPPSFPLKGGVKIDYSTYLRAPAASRAWMHAAGAITTKLVPFALTGAAFAADLPAWAAWVVPAIGVAAIFMDVLWSTKRSDWKKFRREMAFARAP